MNRTQRQRFVSKASKQQRWLLSYVHFLTLLVALCVFLLALSSREPEQFVQVSATLSQIFSVRPTHVGPIELDSTRSRPDFINHCASWSCNPR